MKLIGPHGVIGTDSPEAYERRQREFCSARGEFLKDQSVPLVAYVSAARWVSDCPVCNAGISLHREWPVGRCLGCGSVFKNIRWPHDFDAIEDALVLRLNRTTQNWQPTETVDDLIAENDQRGVGKRG